MHWFTENSWPLVILLGGAALCVLIIAPRRTLLISGLLLAAAAGIWCFEAAVVTPAEELEQEIHAMLEAFRNDDLAEIRSRISPAAPELVQTAESGLELVDLHASFHIRDLQIVADPDGERATAELRANGQVTVRRQNMSRHVATRWRTVWEREAGHWRLTRAVRLNVVTGEEIGPLSRG